MSVGGRTVAATKAERSELRRSTQYYHHPNSSQSPRHYMWWLRNWELSSSGRPLCSTIRRCGCYCLTADTELLPPLLIAVSIVSFFAAIHWWKCASNFIMASPECVWPDCTRRSGFRKQWERLCRKLYPYCARQSSAGTHALAVFLICAFIGTLCSFKQSKSL